MVARSAPACVFYCGRLLPLRLHGESDLPHCVHRKPLVLHIRGLQWARVEPPDRRSGPRRCESLVRERTMRSHTQTPHWQLQSFVAVSQHWNVSESHSQTYVAVPQHNTVLVSQVQPNVTV